MKNKEYTINDLKINPTVLSENGYMKYTDNLKDKETYIGSWQKCVRNEYGKAYFINFNFHDNSYYYNFSREHLITANPFSWEADLQFNDMDEEMTINVKIFSSNKDLESVEKFCDKLFKKMEFQNYEYWEDNDKANHLLEQKSKRVTEDALLLEKELVKNDSWYKPKNKKI